MMENFACVHPSIPFDYGAKTSRPYFDDTFREECPQHGTGNAEALTIVVGHESYCKARVACAFAKALAAPKEMLTKAGFRIFTREHDPTTPVVIEATPFETRQDLSRVDAARLWLSQNSLRKLSGQLVFLVCVIASTDPKDEMSQHPNFTRNRFSWQHVLGCVFKDHVQKVMILVNSEDSTHEAYRNRLPQLEEVLKRDGFPGQNILFFNYGRSGELATTVKSVIPRSVYRIDTNEAGPRGDKSASPLAGPFRLPFVEPHAKDTDRYGPWGPENIIVFGKTGSGKTTLTQMLTLGRLDPYSRTFSIGTSIRGMTRKVRYLQGRGWRVIDTPGLGEPKEDGKSSVPTSKAGNLIKEYLQLKEGTFCHLIYVWKKDRLEELDDRLWEIFRKAFKGEMDHMTVVVSNADKEWLSANFTRLQNRFEGCRSFVTADFPPFDPDYDHDSEQEAQGIREASLMNLEEELASLHRTDIGCKVGMWSVGTQRSSMVRGADKAVTLRAPIRQSAAFDNYDFGNPHPSDYETGRAVIRMKKWTKMMTKCFS